MSKITEKIAKLLALAESPYEEEAKAALLQARRLMAEHIRTSPALSAAVMSTHGISDAAVHWAIGRSYARAVSRKSIRSRWKICAM